MVYKTKLQLHSCRPPQDPAAGAAAHGTLGLMTPGGVIRPRVPPVSPTTHPTKNPGREVFSHSDDPLSNTVNSGPKNTRSRRPKKGFPLPRGFHVGQGSRKSSAQEGLPPFVLYQKCISISFVKPRGPQMPTKSLQPPGQGETFRRFIESPPIVHCCGKSPTILVASRWHSFNFVFRPAQARISLGLLYEPLGPIATRPVPLQGQHVHQSWPWDAMLDK